MLRRLAWSLAPAPHESDRKASRPEGLEAGAGEEDASVAEAGDKGADLG